MTKAKASESEIARKLGLEEAYVSKRKKAINDKEKMKIRGITKEELGQCLRNAKFPEEQIQRILGKELKNLLKRAYLYRVNKILEILISYKISTYAIESSLSTLAEGEPRNIRKVLKLLLVEYKISKEAVERALYVCYIIKRKRR